jgi:hypothetical protein
LRPAQLLNHRERTSNPSAQIFVTDGDVGMNQNQLSDEFLFFIFVCLFEPRQESVD